MNRTRIVIFFVIAGLFLGMLVKSLNQVEEYVSPKDMYSISISIEAAKQEISILNEKIGFYEKQLENSILALDDIRLSYQDILREELNEYKALSGSTALNGEGVVIFVSDGNRELGERENPNNVLIHDIDIRAIVDDLRFAGAEAISINDERILLEYSKIKCVGPTIRINDKFFASPYTIKAIGDRKLLEASLNSPDGFTESLRGFGLFIEVNTAVNVEIPAFKFQ